MAKKIKFNGTGDGVVDHGVHFEDNQLDYTLCRITLDQDPSTGGGYSYTKERVDCESCIRIIEYCKSIKKSEYINP